MNEFPFPPTRIASQWVIPVHAAFVAIIVASFVAFIWRLRRPVYLGDVLGWMVVFAVAVVLCNISYNDEILRPAWVTYTRLVGYLTCYAAMVTVLRFWSPKVSTLTALARGLLCVFPPAALLELALAAGCIIPMDFGRQRGAWHHSDCGNQLRYILFAMHSYEELHRHFVPPVVETEGLPARSWRVDLLPFLDQSPLRKRYSVDDQWDGSRNSTLSQEMPHEFTCAANPGTTVDHNGTAWRTTDYAMVKGPSAFGSPTGRKFSELPDGATNTVAIVEAAGRRIPWLKPEDVEPTADTTSINAPGSAHGRSRSAISSYHPGGAMVGMADGSVRFVSERVDLKTLQAILTVDGGKTPGGF